MKTLTVEGRENAMHKSGMLRERYDHVVVIQNITNAKYFDVVHCCHKKDEQRQMDEQLGDHCMNVILEPKRKESD